MPFDMKKECESCQTTLNADGLAFICSGECTFCKDCAEKTRVCPNCDGELVPRPRQGAVGQAKWMTLGFMEAFNQAWLDGDTEFLNSCITEDCVYSSSVGGEPGETFVGRKQVEEGFRKMLSYEDGSDGQSQPVHISGNRGFSEWSYFKKSLDGKLVKVRGCDFFEFDGNRICRKDAFIKSSPVQGTTL